MRRTFFLCLAAGDWRRLPWLRPKRCGTRYASPRDGVYFGGFWGAILGAIVGFFALPFHT